MMRVSGWDPQIAAFKMYIGYVEAVRDERETEFIAQIPQDVRLAVHGLLNQHLHTDMLRIDPKCHAWPTKELMEDILEDANKVLGFCYARREAEVN